MTASTTSSRSRRGLEPDEPRPARWVQRLRDRDRRGRLADAARSDDRDEAFGREAPTDLVDVVVAPDERRRERWQVAHAPRSRERVILREDAVLEVAQLGSGFEPELVDEDGANPCAGGQRVGLAAGLVEPGDHQRPEALLVRVRLDRGFEVGEHTGISRALTGREQRLEQRGPRRAQPYPMRGRPIARRGQRLVAEPCNPCGGARRGTLEITRVEALLRGNRILDHRVHVDRRRLDLEAIPVARADDERTVAERLSQLRHLRLQRVPLRGDCGVAPQVLDEALGAHETIRRRRRGAPAAPTSCRTAPRRRLRRA